MLRLLGPLALIQTAFAAPVTWTAQAVPHADLAQPADVTPVSTAGTLVAAVNVGGAAETVNGVPFSAGSGNINLSSCNWSVPNVTWGYSFGSYYTASGAGSPANTGNNWLSGGKYGQNANSVGTLNLLNLTVGNQYVVQLFFADIRTASNGSKVIVDGGSPNQFAFGPGSGPYGYLAVSGTFIADASTQAITMRNETSVGAAANTQINAFQFRDLGVPTVVLTPTFSMPGGTYLGSQTVTVSCGTPGATIYYTTDGNTPTNASPSGVSGLAVSLPVGTTTLQAYGYLDGNSDSAIASTIYTMEPTSSSIWINANGGSWIESNNWQGNVIPLGGTADFSNLDLTNDALVTLDGPRTMAHLIFGDTTASNDWTLDAGTGDSLTMALGIGTPSITVTNQTATLGLVLEGNKGFVKGGAGTLALTGANTYIGNTTLSEGTLLVSNLASHRSSVAIANGATFEANVAADVEAPNSFNITGTGTLVKTGAGIWHIGASGRVGIAMSAGGLIDIQEGTISTGSHQQSWTDNQAAMNIASGATVNLPAENLWIDALDGAGTITNSYAPSGARTVNVGVADGSGTFSGTINSGSLLFLNKRGTGTQILIGNNTYTGTTTISGGILQLGNGATSGSLAAGSSITNNGTLAFNRSDDISQGVHFSGNAIGGSGGLTQMGPGTLTLTANNTYTGTTRVTGGELAIGLAQGTTWNVATLDLADSTKLTLRNFDSTSGTPAANATAGLTTTGTVTILVEGNFTVGTFPLIYYPVETEIGGAGYGAFVLGNMPDGVIAFLEHDPDADSINLRVEAAGTPFSNWMAANHPSLTGNNALEGSDPDFDGMNNLAEFAFNGDPTSGSNNGLLAALPIDTNSNGSKELTLTVAVRSGAIFTGSPSPTDNVDGVTYTIQGSLDLNAFTIGVTELTPALTPEQTGLPNLTGSDWEYHTFILTGSEGLPGKGFMRAVVNP